MARAIESRCIIPPEKPRTMWSARSVSLNLLQQFVRAPRPLLRALPEVRAVERQDLARRQREIQIRPLRHHADQPLRRHLLFPDVVLADERPPAGRLACASSESRWWSISRRRSARAARRSRPRRSRARRRPAPLPRTSSSPLRPPTAPAKMKSPRRGRAMGGGVSYTLRRFSVRIPIPIQSSSISRRARSRISRTRSFPARPAARMLSLISIPTGPQSQIDSGPIACPQSSHASARSQIRLTPIRIARQFLAPGRRQPIDAPPALHFRLDHPSASSCCSVGYVLPALARYMPPERCSISFMSW